MKRKFLSWVPFVLLFLFIQQGYTQVITFTGQELLGRPTQSSVTVNVVADQALESYFEFGIQPGVYTGQTGVLSTAANDPVEAVIAGLQANTLYYYRMVYRRTGTTAWIQRAEHSFRTQRSAGSTFAFDITSDSHINVGGLGVAATWQRTLTNVNSDDPDFLVDLGDTFSMDNVNSESSARTSYLFQRSASTFGLVSPSVPVFLAVGNHEQQEAWHLNDNGNPVNSQPVWGTNAQKRYFLNPVPDAFYSGNTDGYPHLNGDQLREDYYAWTWGNALFVVIAPYWYTTSKPFIGNLGGGEPGASDGDRWHWTLGTQQYNWLRQVLQNNNVLYKFVFMHHMTGGTVDYIRGGAYAAPYCEWGGQNEDGSTGAFSTRRPGWYAPIHQVMAENHVSAVFHGHDHQYAYELLDGIVYHSLPAAGFNGNGFNIYNENDPLTIRVLPSPGHLRVTVSPVFTNVEYISSNATSNGQILHSYTITPFVNAALPVQLEVFNVRTEENKRVILSWKTASEHQSKQFIIQRNSSPGGTGYRNIGTVLSANSPNGASYSFTDEPGPAGSYLYRLLHEDTDGKQTYSGTRLARINAGVNWLITDKGNNWEIHSNLLTHYSLSDFQGRLIEKGSFSGTRNIIKPTGGAFYFIRLESNGEITTRKLVR